MRLHSSWPGLTRPSTSWPQKKTWMPGTSPVMTTEYVEAPVSLSLRPCPAERKAAHRADAHFAGDAVAGNLAGELQRQRHRVGDRDFPGDVVAVGRAVEDRGRIAAGTLRPRQRAA